MLYVSSSLLFSYLSGGYSAKLFTKSASNGEHDGVLSGGYSAKPFTKSESNGEHDRVTSEEYATSCY